MKNRMANNRGVTLVEIMVAALFMAISGVALSIMFVQGRVMINETRHRIEVLGRIQQQMERLKYIQKANNGELPLSENRTFTDTLVMYTPGAPSFTISLDAEVLMVPSPQSNGSGYPLYYDVSVIYRWDEPSGRNCELLLRGLF